MTSHQQEHLDGLADIYRSVGVRPDGDSKFGIIIDCFDVALPERCSLCGEEADDHPIREIVHVNGRKTRDRVHHDFRVAVPVATFRVGSNGFRQDVTPVSA